MATSRPFHRWRPHPWHGLEAGPDVPRVVHAYIEITPFDLIKYEVDKETGYLRVDRPQRTSSQPPALYGFVPRTYCGPRSAALCDGAQRGDGDPLDICVVSERPIHRTEIIAPARVLGGLQLLDGGEADDKIIAVLASDALWSEVTELEGLPAPLVERIRHYFLTYKLAGPDAPPRVRLNRVYGREHAYHVLEAAREDYAAEFASA